jgi:hypothetical protein
MAKVRPLVMNFGSADELEKMRQEYEFIGREVETNQAELKLTVLTLPKKYKRKAARENKIRNTRRENDFDFEEYED